MQLNLLGLYTKILGLRAWADSGSSLKEKIRTSINLALSHVAMDAPSAFYPDKEHIVLFPDATTASSERYLYRTVDHWVLEFRDVNFDVQALPIPDGTWMASETGACPAPSHDGGRRKDRGQMTGCARFQLPTRHPRWH